MNNFYVAVLCVILGLLVIIAGETYEIKYKLKDVVNSLEYQNKLLDSIEDSTLYPFPTE